MLVHPRMNLTLGSLHHAIIRTFVECGRAPTNAQLCERFRVESDEMTSVDDWCRRHAIPRGDVQPIQRVYDFARDWYGRHLDEDRRKWTTEEARQIFSRHGLTGPIWDVPMSAERF